MLRRYGSGFTFVPSGDLTAPEQAFRTFWEALPAYREPASTQSSGVSEDFPSARMAPEYDACFRRAMERFQSDNG